MAKLRRSAAATIEGGRKIVVQTKRGSCRPEDRVSVDDINVPDLWHSFEALERVAGEIRRDNPTNNVVVDARAKTLEHVSEAAQRTWNIASDMKRCLQETVAPAVGETMLVLEALKAESDIRQLTPEDLQRALDALSRAFTDGRR